MTETTKQVTLPENPHLLNWTAQDTIDRLMNEDDDRYEAREIQDFLVNCSLGELSMISDIITLKDSDTRQMTSVIIESNVDRTFRKLLDLARGKQPTGDRADPGRGPHSNQRG